MPEMCRLEYLTPAGWEMGHKGIMLNDPERYVQRLAAKNKFGRCTVLGPDLQPTSTVYVPPDLPEDLSVLVPTDTRIPAIGCSLCGATDHRFEGECLL